MFFRQRIFGFHGENFEEIFNLGNAIFSQRERFKTRLGKAKFSKNVVPALLEFCKIRRQIYLSKSTFFQKKI